MGQAANNAEETARFQLQTLQSRPSDVNGVVQRGLCRPPCGKAMPFRKLNYDS